LGVSGRWFGQGWWTQGCHEVLLVDKGNVDWDDERKEQSVGEGQAEAVEVWELVVIVVAALFSLVCCFSSSDSKVVDSWLSCLDNLQWWLRAPLEV
jgi:hypothetical protein